MFGLFSEAAKQFSRNCCGPRTKEGSQPDEDKPGGGAAAAAQAQGTNPLRNNIYLNIQRQPQRLSTDQISPSEFLKNDDIVIKREYYDEIEDLRREVMSDCLGDSSHQAGNYEGLSREKDLLQKLNRQQKGNAQEKNQLDQSINGSRTSSRAEKRHIKLWTPEEDEMLKAYHKQFNGKWQQIADYIPGRNVSQCSQRWRRIKPEKVRKPWTKAEDVKLVELIAQHKRNWGLIAQKMTGRTGKQVRERWINKLDPTINRQPWQDSEDQLIIQLFRKIGPKWCEISQSLEGRPENAVKNRFYSHIRKQFIDLVPTQSSVAAELTAATVKKETHPLIDFKDEEDGKVENEDSFNFDDQSDYVDDTNQLNALISNDQSASNRAVNNSIQQLSAPIDKLVFNGTGQQQQQQQLQEQQQQKQQQYQQQQIASGIVPTLDIASTSLANKELSNGHERNKSATKYEIISQLAFESQNNSVNNKYSNQERLSGHTESDGSRSNPGSYKNLAFQNAPAFFDEKGAPITLDFFNTFEQILFGDRAAEYIQSFTPQFQSIKQRLDNLLPSIQTPTQQQQQQQQYQQQQQQYAQADKVNGLFSDSNGTMKESPREVDLKMEQEN